MVTGQRDDIPGDRGPGQRLAPPPDQCPQDGVDKPCAPPRPRVRDQCDGTVDRSEVRHPVEVEQRVGSDPQGDLHFAVHLHGRATRHRIEGVIERPLPSEDAQHDLVQQADLPGVCHFPLAALEQLRGPCARALDALEDLEGEGAGRRLSLSWGSAQAGLLARSGDR
jgi:hypothetical protein